MSTFSNKQLTINNFMSPVLYKVGRGKNIKEKSIQNFYDNKLNFLNNAYVCTVYEVVSQTFLPNLSVKFYGTSSLWWVIARFNGIVYPLSEIKVGTTLYIPNLSQIAKNLNTAKVTTNNSALQQVLL